MENNEKKSFIELALKYRQVPILITVVLCIIGISALFNMPRQEFPEFHVRQGLVIGGFPGASSEQVDEQLAKPLQNYLFQYKEINRKRTYSVSKEGQVVVFLEVNENIKEPDIFWSKLRLGLQEFKSQLPSQVLLLVGDNNFGDASAILLSMTSKERSYRELEDYLEKLENLIRQNPAVSNVKHFGLQKEKIVIYADPNKLAYYGIQPSIIMAALQLESMVGYGGTVTDTNLVMPIHLPQQFKSEADVAEQIIYTSPNGSIVRIRDVARVVREYDIDKSYVEFNGQKALVLSMEMHSGNNIVKFGKQIDKTIKEFKNTIPKDVEISKIADMPAVVSHSITGFFRDFGMAVLSVIIVIMIFLPKRVAAVAALTIPISILIAMGVLQSLGVELNTVSLATLVLVLGMIVDNAIVVIDNHIEKLDHGIDVWTAAWSSAKELFIPVFTATLAIIAAFYPMPMFMDGMYKEFVSPIPITVAVTLFISLLVASLFVPILSYSFIKKGIHSKEKTNNKKTMLDRLQSFYDVRIALTMSKPKQSITIGVVCIFLGIFLLTLIPQETFPKLERNQFAVEIYFPEGTSLEDNAKTTKEMARILSQDKRVTDVASFIGTSSPRFNTLYAPQIPAKNYSQLIVMTDTNKNTKKVLAEYDPKYRDAFPNAHVRWKELDFLPAAALIEIRISGDTIEEIKTFSNQIKELLKQEKDIIWVRDDYRNPLLSIDLDINKEAANRLAITRGMLGLSTALNRNGMTVATVWENDYPKEVLLKYEESKTSTPEKLSSQYISAPLSPKPVMLRQVAKLKPSFSQGQVIRRNGRYTLTVSADVAFHKLSNPILKKVAKKIDNLSKPSSIKVVYGGEYEKSIETYGPFSKSLATSIVLIFFILFFQFKSIRLTLLIMCTMPLSLIGGALGLLIIGYPFGMTSFIGFIALFGIVVRNGVILISYAHELEKKGMSVRDAAIAAGKRRMRPIFLTASAAAVGVIPLITSGSLLWGPLGTVICFGLIGSTILTLYVLPVAYWKLGEAKNKEQKDEK
ncbi:MAG: efflux RND transporter permease subunit [Endomicrobiaceae bacterium]|nr:efflux RND transporter permease subunit [Endomicrobiaceae bacterium]